jgi:hypothetical protein
MDSAAATTEPHPLFLFIRRSDRPTQEKIEAFDALEALLAEIQKLRANQRTGRIIHGDA